MTDEEIYEQYNAFVTQQIREGVHPMIPHGRKKRLLLR